MSKKQSKTIIPLKIPKSVLHFNHNFDELHNEVIRLSTLNDTPKPNPVFTDLENCSRCNPAVSNLKVFHPTTKT